MKRAPDTAADTAADRAADTPPDAASDTARDTVSDSAAGTAPGRAADTAPGRAAGTAPDRAADATPPGAAVASAQPAASAAPEQSGRPGTPGALRVWWTAARPRTLVVAFGPVAVGSAVALAEGRARAGPALAALLGALLLQLASNFANDVYDSEKGADGEGRLGPPRAVALGWLAPAQMKLGLALALAAAAAVGAWLVGAAGWPVVAVGLASMAAAVLYTGGPWPLGYHGLGDLAVFVFFGLVAVVGTEYVQSLRWSGAALAAALPVGCLATAVLVVNNLRDIEGDRAAGKRTLAVRLGAAAARREYALLLLAPYLLVLGSGWVGGRSAWVALPWLTLPMALRLVRRIGAGASGAALNPLLGRTASHATLFALAFALGYAL